VRPFFRVAAEAATVEANDQEERCEHCQGRAAGMGEKVRTLSSCRVAAPVAVGAAQRGFEHSEVAQLASIRTFHR
jgi:hypothetical protein